MAAGIGFTTYGRDLMLNHFFRATDMPHIAQVEVAALIQNATLMDGSDAVEVDSVAHPEYARVVVEFNAPETDGVDATFRKVVSSADELWPNASSNWGQIVGVAAYVVGGNMFWTNPVETAKDIATADTLRITGGDLQIGFKNAS